MSYDISHVIVMWLSAIVSRHLCLDTVVLQKKFFSFMILPHLFAVAGHRLKILWGKPQASLPAPGQGGVALPPVPGLPNGKHAIIIIRCNLIFKLSPLALPPPTFDPFNLRGESHQPPPPPSSGTPHPVPLMAPPPPPPPLGAGAVYPPPPPPPPGTYVQRRGHIVTSTWNLSKQEGTLGMSLSDYTTPA